MFRLGQPRSDLTSIAQRVRTLENTCGTVVPRIGGLENVYHRLLDRLDVLDCNIAKIETCVNALGEKHMDAFQDGNSDSDAKKHELSISVEQPKALPGPALPAKLKSTIT